VYRIGQGNERPIAAFQRPFEMLRCGPSFRPFAATAKSKKVEFTQRGQTGLTRLQRMQLQKDQNDARICSNNNAAMYRISLNQSLTVQQMAQFPTDV